MVCLYEELNCTNSGCNSSVLRKDMKTHLDVHCLYRKVTCQYCKEMYLAGEVEVSRKKAIEIREQYETFVQVQDDDMVFSLKTLNRFHKFALVFSIKETVTLIKIGFHCRCFPVNFVKLSGQLFYRTPLAKKYALVLPVTLSKMDSAVGVFS